MKIHVKVTNNPAKYNDRLVTDKQYCMDYCSRDLDIKQFKL